VEATNNVFEPSRLAPGDAVPLLRCAPMVVVDGLEVVVLVVPARDDGVAAALSREDAIDATAVFLTRRDGPDAVRNSSKSKKKPLSWK